MADQPIEQIGKAPSMTYPPQPGQPYGQQPDPYGQGGHPPTGGFPQQYPDQPYPGQQYPNQPYGGQQQYPGYDQSGAYGQQPYPGYEQQYPQTQQYAQGFGGPPAPPKKSKTGLLIAAAATVVVLIAVGVTGFIAPGFFLSKDKAAGPEQVAQAIVDGLNSKDKSALTALKCVDAETDVTQAIEGVGILSGATLNDVRKVSDSEYAATVTVSVSGRPGTVTGTIASAGEKWCWKEIRAARTSGTSSRTPTSSPRFPTSSRSLSPSVPLGTVPAAGEAVVKNFLDKINTKDKAGASALVCPGREGGSSAAIDRVSSASAQLAAELTGSSTYISGQVRGTVDGKEVQGLIGAKAEADTFCVSLFSVF